MLLPLSAVFCQRPRVSEELLVLLVLLSSAPPRVRLPGLLGSRFLKLTVSPLSSAPLKSALLPMLTVMALSDISLLPRALVWAIFCVSLALSRVMPMKLLLLSVLVWLLLVSVAA